LRIAGCVIECERSGDVWSYTMTHRPEPKHEKEN
jgi:hypothetical protein